MDASLVELDAAWDPNGILICVGGIEDRSTTATRRLGGRLGKFERVILIKYSHGDPRNEQHFEQLFALVRDERGHDPVVIELDRSNLMRASVQIRSGISEQLGQLRSSGVCIDITGLASVLIASALHEINRRGAQFTILYTEADEYVPTEKEQELALKAIDADRYELADTVLQTASVKDLHIPTEFSGNYRPNHQVCLFDFVGFEPHRVSGLIDDYSPAAAIVFYGKSPHSDLQWRTEFSRNLHQGLFSRWHVHETYTSTLDVAKIMQDLEDQYRIVSSVYDVAVAPQCSKMQVVAAYLFWRRHPEVQLVFTSAALYLRDSKGSRRTFLLAPT